MAVRRRALRKRGHRAVHERPSRTGCGQIWFLATRAARVISKTAEVVGLRKDGVEFHMELSLAFGRSAGQLFFTGVIRDITEHRCDLHAEWLGDRQPVAEAGGGSPTLECASTWCPTRFRDGAFMTMTKEITFARGVGLPGRVWASGKAAAIENVVDDANFPRARTAAEDGLHGAFGFPILAGGVVLGVIEFFSREPYVPSDEMLDTMLGLGSQIGQFVQRKREEETLKEREESSVPR